MIRSLYPFAAALILAAPAAAQTTKAPAAKSATGKKAPAKPAASKAAAKPKPVATAGKPLNVAEQDGFGVIELAAADANSFIAAWKIGDAQPAASMRTVANKPLFVFLVFRGCKADAEGKCDIVADFVIHRPDGTINDENKGIAVWNKPAPGGPEKSYLGDGALGYGTDEEGPFGKYRVVATTTDRVANTSVTTELTLTIDPDPKAPAKPAGTKQAEPPAATPDPAPKPADDKPAEPEPATPLPTEPATPPGK